MLINDPKSIAHIDHCIDAIRNLAQNAVTDSAIDDATEVIYEAFTMHSCTEPNSLECACDADGIISPMMQKLLDIVEAFDAHQR